MNAQTAPLPPQGFHTREGELFAQQFGALQQLTGKIVPPRKAFTPQSVRALLPYIALLEVQGPGVILVRLVGTAVINRAHVDMTGRNLLDFYPEEARDWAWQHHMRMLKTPCGSTFLSRENFDDHVMYSEIVNYPLADETGSARFVLGVAVETNRRDLLLRGDNAMEIGALLDQRFLDIGAGT